MFICSNFFLQGLRPMQISKAVGGGAQGLRTLSQKIEIFLQVLSHSERPTKNKQSHQHDDYRKRLQDPNDAMQC